MYDFCSRLSPIEYRNLSSSPLSLSLSLSLQFIASHVSLVVSLPTAKDIVDSDRAEVMIDRTTLSRMNHA